MSAPTPTSSSADQPTRRRRWTIAVLVWLYGISITVFLFSIWGRAVVVDAALLSEAASRAAGSQLVSSRVEGWFESELAELGMGQAAEAIGDVVVGLPEVRSATARLMAEVVSGVAEPTQNPVVVDVAAVYRPAVPAVTSALGEAGLPVTRDQVEEVVDRLDPLVIDTDPARPPLGPRSGAARSLTVATLMALAAMLTSGGAAVMASHDRRAMFRDLLNRLAVSGFTYFVFFQVSAWVLDPGGGRAPARAGLSHIVGSKLWIPLLIGAVAGGVGWLIRHRHRREPPPGESPPAPR